MTAAPFDLSAHVALVTGANHGIGAATARALSACGARVLITYLRVEDEADSGIPEAHRRHRALNADEVLAAIRAAGGQAIEMEADLADPAAAVRLFDIAEAELGPVDILVNNASGWLPDTFTTEARDQFGRGLLRVSSETFERQFSVDNRKHRPAALSSMVSLGTVRSFVFSPFRRSGFWVLGQIWNSDYSDRRISRNRKDSCHPGDFP